MNEISAVVKCPALPYCFFRRSLKSLITGSTNNPSGSSAYDSNSNVKLVKVNSSVNLSLLPVKSSIAASTRVLKTIGASLALISSRRSNNANEAPNTVTLYTLSGCVSALFN